MVIAFTVVIVKKKEKVRKVKIELRGWQWRKGTGDDKMNRQKGLPKEMNLLKHIRTFHNISSLELASAYLLLHDKAEVKQSLFILYLLKLKAKGNGRML